MLWYIPWYINNQGVLYDFWTVQINAWVQGKRNPNVKEYFPMFIINEPGFLSFFKKQPQFAWKGVQKAFIDIEKTENEERIFYETDNSEEFFICLLMQFYKLLGITPVSLCSFLPSNSGIFIKREKEIQDIKNILSTSSYLLLTGDRGIGKSCTALDYAYKMQTDENYIVQYVICEHSDSLRDAVSKLQFSGFNTDNNYSDFENKIMALRNCRQPILIVFDNLSKRFSTRGAQNDFSDFEQLKKSNPNIQILIISRDSMLLRDLDREQRKQHLYELKQMEE